MDESYSSVNYCHRLMTIHGSLSSGAISEQDVQLTAHDINPLSYDLWTQISQYWHYVGKILKKSNLQCS